MRIGKVATGGTWTEGSFCLPHSGFSHCVYVSSYMHMSLSSLFLPLDYGLLQPVTEFSLILLLPAQLFTVLQSWLTFFFLFPTVHFLVSSYEITYMVITVNIYFSVAQITIFLTVPCLIISGPATSFFPCYLLPGSNSKMLDWHILLYVTPEKSLLSIRG